MHVEASVHPHSEEEQADLFHALDGGSTEVEYLVLLQALVFASKPTTVLETGTGRGFGTLAIATALRANGFGHLTTIEHDSSVMDGAKRRLEESPEPLGPLVTFHCGSSLDFLQECTTRFDFVFLDSDISVRHEELRVLLERDLLTERAIVCIHDTSRLRSRTAGDNNLDMNTALDQFSIGREWLEFDLSRGFRILRFGGASKR